MKKNALFISVVLVLALLVDVSLHAAFTIRRGQFVDACEIPTMSVQEHFAAGAKAYEAKDWDEAARQFSVVTFNFPKTSYGQEAFYFLGVSHYFRQEYDYANDAFSDYLKGQASPLYFQNVIEFKFCIASQLHAGAKRRFLGTKKLPKWACGQNLALEIYDEVIAAVPCSDLAAKALMAKACLQWKMRSYRPAVESFQMVIRRFPKHEQTPDCYLYIGKVFLEQSHYEFQNSDILAFAQINLRKFERDFPREERLCEAREDVMSIKEVYAAGLYETGQFYERSCQPRAAVIYYKDAIRQFPDTCTAELSRKRLLCLNPSYFKEIDSAADASKSERQREVDFGAVESCEET